MPVSVKWFDDTQEIVFYTFQGNWTWDELYPVYKTAIGMETSVPHRVDVLIDMALAKSVPANALMHVKNISDKQPENLGLTIVVTSSGFVQALYNAGVKFYKGIAHYFRVAPTVDEGMRMIADDRQARNNQPLGKAPGVKKTGSLQGHVNHPAHPSTVVHAAEADQTDKRQS